MKSPKENVLEKKILGKLETGSNSRRLCQLLLSDDKLQAMQEYGNSVSIKRMNYNDHGPVHMRQVCYNALKMLDLLHGAGLETSLETEEMGSYDDSRCGVVIASLCHDLGMGISRQDHELVSMVLARPMCEKWLEQTFSNNLQKRVSIGEIALEGIYGHMGNRKITSMEAGIILVADGCDMEKGRSRIPLALHTEPQVGDIHKYSANAIEKVRITKGDEKPIRIDIEMSAEIGMFQIEEVLLQKISKSTIRDYLEVVAKVPGLKDKHYL
jgi:metal-dependent HD superfamily phosphatase/phosphodiesterase